MGRAPSKEAFRHLSDSVAAHVGRPWAFGLACGVVLIWGLSGPIFHFSDTWQLVINTGTTIITFLMVFLIQATQNRDARAVHLKLDELIRATTDARNVFADLEHASETEIQAFQHEFRRLREEGATEVIAARGAHRVLHPPGRHHRAHKV